MFLLDQLKRKKNIKRYRPSKGRRCIPDIVIQVHVETYLNDFSSLAQVEIQFRTYLKKRSNFCFSMLQQVPVKNFPLMHQLLMYRVRRTDIDEAKVISAPWHKSKNTSQNSILNFFRKKIAFLGFHAVVLVKTFPLMYQLPMQD